MRWLRLGAALLISRFRSKIKIADTIDLPVWIWLTDIDVSIANHAALLTILEVGRIDFMVRSGFFRMAREKKWYFPMSTISVKYYRPLKAFKKVTLSTRVSYIDHQWIYLEQKIWSKGKDYVFSIVKGPIKSGREKLDPRAVLSPFGLDELSTHSLELVESSEMLSQHMDLSLNQFR